MASNSGSTAQRGEADKYDVFVNFKGDQRFFARGLKAKLEEVGIAAFVDDESMRPGLEIGSAILPALRSATISIPVFGEDYSRSKWCLIELSEMVECMDKNRQVILPVFYSVEPEAVKEVKWSIGTGLKSLKKNGGDEEILEKGKAALRRVGRLKGWQRSKVAHGDDHELIKVIVSEVSKYFKNGEYSGSFK